MIIEIDDFYKEQLIQSFTWASDYAFKHMHDALQKDDSVEYWRWQTAIARLAEIQVDILRQVNKKMEES